MRAPAPRSGHRHEREDGLEFERVAFFSDAVFAIALTLLVVSLTVPNVTDARLGHALGSRGPQFFSFFLSFAVIGWYWLRYHDLVSRLRAVDHVFIVVNLAFLAAIAFVPFPSALMGKYGGVPLAVILYAAVLGAASLAKTALSVVAHDHDLYRRDVTEGEYRAMVRASSVPVVVFAISIPIALASPLAAQLSWLLMLPALRIARSGRGRRRSPIRPRRGRG